MKLRDLAVLLALASIWGASFLFIRVAAPVLDPVILAEARVAIAGAALVIYALATRRNLTLRAHWKNFLFLGAVNAAAPYALIALAELQLTAGMGAILNATTPLFTALVAALWIRDPLTFKKLAGMVIGLVGVGVLVGWSPLPINLNVLLAIGALLLGSLCYGVGSVYARKAMVGVAPLASATGQQLGAVVALLPLAIPVGIIAGPTIHLTWTVALAALTLALLCTSVAYLLYFYLIAHIGATSTTTVTMLVPVFGLLWSALFLHEVITPGAIVALLIIISSVVLITGLRLPLPRRRIQAAPVVAAVREELQKEPIAVGE